MLKIYQEVWCIRPKVLSTIPFVSTKEVVKGWIHKITSPLSLDLRGQEPTLEELTCYINLENGYHAELKGDKVYLSKKDAEDALIEK